MNRKTARDTRTTSVVGPPYQERERESDEWRECLDAARKNGLRPAQLRSYLARQLEAAIQSVVVSARTIGDWLTDEMARPLAKRNLTMWWLSPIGFPVVHDYRRTKRVRIQAGGIRVSLRKQDAESRIAVKKQQQAIVANFIIASTLRT